MNQLEIHRSIYDKLLEIEKDKLIEIECKPSFTYLCDRIIKFFKQNVKLKINKHSFFIGNDMKLNFKSTNVNYDYNLYYLVKRHGNINDRSIPIDVKIMKKIKNNISIVFTFSFNEFSNNLNEKDFMCGMDLMFFYCKNEKKLLNDSLYDFFCLRYELNDYKVRKIKQDFLSVNAFNILINQVLSK